MFIDIKKHLNSQVPIDLTISSSGKNLLTTISETKKQEYVITQKDKNLMNYMKTDKTHEQQM